LIWAGSPQCFSYSIILPRAKTVTERDFALEAAQLWGEMAGYAAGIFGKPERKRCGAAGKKTGFLRKCLVRA